MEFDAEFIRKIVDNLLSLAILIFFVRHFMKDSDAKSKVIAEVVEANSKVVQQNTEVTIELKELIQNEIHCIAKYGNGNVRA